MPGPRAAADTLGAECLAWPVRGAMSCVMTSRGLLTASQIILQHVGRGSQTRLLSWLAWQEVPRSSLQL